MKIVIRADASLQIGSGHVMRCLTLANYLKNHAEILFLCRPHEGNLIKLIEQNQFSVRVLNPPNLISDYSLVHSQWLGSTQKEDAQQCLKALGVEKYDWMIVDHYALDKTWQFLMKESFRKLMVIDDLGDRCHICDLLLDQNFGSNHEKYKGLIPKNCYVLLGPEFTLLRNEFTKWREISIKRRSNYLIKNILINLGGVDKENYTNKIIKEIEKSNLSRDIEIIVVLGKTSPHIEAVMLASKNSSFDIHVKTGVQNFAELMSNADLAIGAGGTTTWERCCLGLPTIQLVIAENQKILSESLSNINALLFLSSPSNLKSALDKAKDNLEVLALNSFNLVDGKGVLRVSNIILLAEFFELGLGLIPYQSLSRNDALEILLMRNNIEIRKWMTNKKIITIKEHLNFISNLSKKKNCLFLVLKNNCKIIGTINFTSINKVNGSAEFGIFANPFLFEKGRGERLMKAAMLYSKNCLRLKRLNLQVFAENKAAINLYKKYNFFKNSNIEGNQEDLINMSNILDKS